MRDRSTDTSCIVILLWPSSAVRHAAYRSERIEAIAYHSAVRTGGLCLAVFPERLGPGSWLEIQDPDGILRERIP